MICRYYGVYWGIPHTWNKKKASCSPLISSMVGVDECIQHPSLCVREGGTWWIRNSFLLTVVPSHQRGLEMLQEFCHAPLSYFRVCLVRVGFERLIFVGFCMTGWTVNCVEGRKWPPCPVLRAGCWSFIISMLQLKYWKIVWFYCICGKFIGYSNENKGPFTVFHSQSWILVGQDDNLSNLKKRIFISRYFIIYIYLYLYRDVIYTFHFSLALLMASSHPTPCQKTPRTWLEMIHPWKARVQRFLLAKQRYPNWQRPWNVYTLKPTCPLKMVVSSRHLLCQGSMFKGELLVSGMVCNVWKYETSLWHTAQLVNKIMHPLIW